MSHEFKVGDLVWWIGHDNQNAGEDFGRMQHGHTYIVERLSNFGKNICHVRIGDEVKVVGPGNNQWWFGVIRESYNGTIRGKITSLLPFIIKWNRDVGGSSSSSCEQTNFGTGNNIPELSLVKPTDNETKKENSKRKDYPPGRRIRL